MRTMHRCRLGVLLLALCWLSVATTAAQSVSPIGKFLEPWGALFDGGCIAMTTDGGTIAFLETQGGCSTQTLQRISMIRPDGTGYRVVVDWPVLEALEEPLPGQTGIKQLRISGDGQWLSFWWPHAYNPTNCSYVPPAHSYVVHVPTGAVTESRFNGLPTTLPSFTDDGQTMAFQGFDPALGDYRYYLSNPDGTGVVALLDPTQWLGSFGAISGDGSKLIIVGTIGGLPYPSHVYLYDIVSGELAQVSAQPLDDIAGASVSRDGSRVVYGAYNGPVYAVNGDGTDHHLITLSSTQGSATITRDGGHVFFTAWNGVGVRDYRTAWDATGLVEINGWNIGFWPVSHQPVDESGSLLAMMAPAISPYQPLAVWFAEPPMLTTYGYGELDTTLTWDVGGAPGDRAILLFALGTVSPGLPLKSWGLLELAPRSLGILWSGLVMPPWDTASLALTIPASLDLPAPVDVHFQAIVMGADATKLTNRTTVTLQPAPSSIGLHSARAGAAIVPSPMDRTIHGADPESTRLRWELVDPSFAARSGGSDVGHAQTR